MWRKFLALLCCFLVYSVCAQGASDAEDTSPTQDASGVQTTSPTQDASGVQTTSPTQDASGVQTTSPTQDASGVQTTNPTQDANDVQATNPTQDANDVQATSPTQDTSEVQDESSVLDISQIKLSSGGRLRYYGADKEDFFVSPDYSSVVRSTDGQLVQKKYDTQYRLIEKITWADNGSILNSISDYTYEDGGVFPASLETQEITSAQFISESYNAAGFVIQREVYSTAKIEDSNSDSTNLDNSSENSTPANVESSEEVEKKLVFTQNWEYDTDNRVVEELIEYADDSKQSEKMEYRFLRGKNKADVFYYAGDTLYKSTVYSSPDDWEEKVYFPDEVEIITIYREKTAVSEQFYQNGIKIRERKR